MTLDAEARALLDRMAAAGRPPTSELSPVEARAGYEAMAGLNPLEPVGRVLNRQIEGPAGPIPVRVYTPEGTGPFPLLVYYHGGGWVIGSLNTHDAVCRALTNATGHVVVSVDYRLAPEHPYPAAVDDAMAALRWVHANAAALNGDPARLSVAGDSAGGNLAAVVALCARDEGGPPLRTQVLVYPVTDCNFETGSYARNGEGRLLTRATMEWFWMHYFQGEGTPPAQAAPLRAERLDGLPPALVITAGYDPLCDEGEAYAERLRAAGVPVTLRRYDGMIHGFFQIPGVFPQARAAYTEVAAALAGAPVA